MNFFKFYSFTIIVSFILILICLYFWNKCENLYKNYYSIHKDDENFYFKRANVHDRLDKSLNNPFFQLNVSLIPMDEDYETKIKASSINIILILLIVTAVPVINIAILIFFLARFIKIKTVMFEELV